MTLQEQIKKDLTGAMKARNEEKKSALRVIMGEFARADKKELSDEEVVRILKNLVKAEQETLEKQGVAASSVFLHTVEAYLPQMAENDEIVTWIDANIDFSQFKSKMQAMGPIMKHFGARADGNAVKSLLQKL
jgi:uncharacterized protein YqeY